MTDQSTKQPPDSPLSGDSAKLPSDRDEKPLAPKEDDQHRHNRRPVEQARRDSESGIQDTERIGTPNDVPASGNGGAG